MSNFSLTVKLLIENKDWLGHLIFFSNISNEFECLQKS